MITLYSQLGFANQIWIYAEARFLAWKYNLKMVFGKHIVGQLKHEQKFCLPDAFYIDWPNGQVLHGTPQVANFQNTPAILKTEPTKPISYYAFTCRTAFLPPMDMLRQWLRPKYIIQNSNTNIIHIRLNDMLYDGYERDEPNSHLSLIALYHFYNASISLLDRTKHTEIVTDDINHPFAQAISTKHNIPIHKNTWLIDWYKLCNASTIVVHYRSTFGWWASQFGNIQKVITCQIANPSPITVKASERLWFYDNK